MAEPSSSSPLANHLVSSSLPVDLPLQQPLPPTISERQPRFLSLFQRRPSLHRVTSEIDSESVVFFHQLSCKFLDGLAKLKLSFPNNQKGEIAEPQLTFASKNLSVDYDEEGEQNALVKSSSSDCPMLLHFGATHDVKAQQVEVAMVEDLADPDYALEHVSHVPSFALAAATTDTDTEGQTGVEPSFSPPSSNQVLSLSLPVDLPPQQPPLAATTDTDTEDQTVVEPSFSPPSSNHLLSLTLPVDLPPQQPPPAPISEGQPPFQRRPSFRVTSEFDSDSAVFFHRLSCKFLGGLAKLKLSFQNNRKGDIAEPQLAFTSKNVSLYYDVEEQNTLVRSSFGVGPRVHFRASHDVKSQQGEVAMVADLADPGYAFELSSPLPAIGLPKATLRFPAGEVSLEEREEEEGEEAKTALSINGIVKGQALDGVWAAQYNDEELKLRYCYKDREMSFIPSISLPSNALSFAFKRQINPSNKLSYWYNFDTNYWSAVYKMTCSKDVKLKAGYDSEVRLGWASLWVGDENGKAKTAPMKVKMQLMLQVPQDNINASTLMFRVKKRLDI